MEFRTWFSMHPLNVLQLWAPFVFLNRYCAVKRVLDGNTHEMGLYTTAFSTVAVAWLAIRWRKLPQRWFILATFLFGLCMLFFAFGKYTWIYLQFADLPLVKSVPLRCPTLLDAHAIRDGYSSRLRRDGPSGASAEWRSPQVVRCGHWELSCSWRRSPPPRALVIVFWPENAVSQWLVSTVKADAGFVPLLGSWEEISAGLALVAAAVGLVVAAARGYRWAVYGIIVLTAAEIGVFNVWGYVWNPPQEKPPAMVGSSPSNERKLPAWETLQGIVDSLSPPPPPNTGRLCHPENDYDAMLAVAGYDLMRGYVALVPAERVPLLLPVTNGQVVLNPVALRLASIHWILIRGQWIASPDPLPRAVGVQSGCQ